MSKRNEQKQNTENAVQNEYPWYDDRVEMIVVQDVTTEQNGDDYDVDAYEEDVDEFDADAFADDDECSLDFAYETPQEIYEYLDARVWKQKEAKKAASVLAYKSLVKGIKSNAMFIGPTGCGKTHIFRILEGIFPDRISIVDASRITMEGWKGDFKLIDVFKSPVFYCGRSAILVLDEFDKLVTPKYNSHSENVSKSILGEMLKAVEGTKLQITDGGVTHIVDTSKISFVFCGAFSDKADEIAERKEDCKIGFGASEKQIAVRAYDAPLTAEDIIEFGCTPELMGRIQRIVNLMPMTKDDYYQILKCKNGPVSRLERRYAASILIRKKSRLMLAEQAYMSGLGIRGIENRLQEMMDEKIFRNGLMDCYKF